MWRQRKKLFCSLFPTSNVQPLRGMQGFSMHRGFFRRQIWRVNGPFSLFYLLAFAAMHIQYGMESPFGQLCPFPWFCPSPAPGCKEDMLGAPSVPSTPQTQVCYQHLPRDHWKAQHCGGCYGENQLCLSQTRCSHTPEAHLGCGKDNSCFSATSTPLGIWVI